MTGHRSDGDNDGDSEGVGSVVSENLVEEEASLLQTECPLGSYLMSYSHSTFKETAAEICMGPG